jgi:hypothetical protein
MSLSSRKLQELANLLMTTLKPTGAEELVRLCPVQQ